MQINKQSTEQIEKECEAIFAKKDKIRNCTFGIMSAVGILGGSIYGISMAKGLYETVLFILFFGCFIGAICGALVTIAVKIITSLGLRIFSSTYRECISARKRARS